MATSSIRPPQPPAKQAPDADRGVGDGDPFADRLCCDGCERMAPGCDCRRWDRYILCPRCEEEYITAWAMGRRLSPGQYVRDKRFGEEEAYTRFG